MIITILAEPRSGSTNLTNWFYKNKKFTTLFEPLNPISKWFQQNVTPLNYSYTTEHLCIKEVYYPHKDWKDIIEISDKIIILYRKDYIKQLESFLNAVRTSNWDGEYVYKHIDTAFIKEKTDYFNQLKTEFKEKYVDSQFFNMSYEELYNENGFQKIVNYLNLDCVKNVNFPYGKKYRIEINKPTTLI
jgi:LPS sulfotransferase NodH